MTSESVHITKQPPGAGGLPGVVGEAKIDGPQAEQLESVPCGQILQDEEAAELSPAG